MEKFFQICYNRNDYHPKEGLTLIPMDCHTHTDISPDSDAPVREMLQSARNQGISVYAVTDHIELCRYYSQCFYGAYPRNEEDFFNYAERWERAMTQNQVMKHMINQDMIFVSGIELGEPDADFPLAESLYKDVRLDFIIASLHELPDKLDFYFLDYAQENIDSLLETYFSELLKIAEWGYFDVLGHITYPLRYIEGDAGIPVDMGKYVDCIAEIFKAVIRNGKGIELNTSGYRQSYGKPFPDESLLKLYRDLGGEILSFGSDAHKPEDVGGGIVQGVQLAKMCGFSKGCYFLNHEPHFIEL